MFLNPRRDLTDLPLKHYYRYVLPAGDAADLAPAAVFARMPSTKVRSIVRLKAREAWVRLSVVEPGHTPLNRIESTTSRCGLACERDTIAL